jgi:hypothetical protein
MQWRVGGEIYADNLGARGGMVAMATQPPGAEGPNAGAYRLYISNIKPANRGETTDGAHKNARRGNSVDESLQTTNRFVPAGDILKTPEDMRKSELMAQHARATKTLIRAGEALRSGNPKEALRLATEAADQYAGGPTGAQAFRSEVESIRAQAGPAAMREFETIVARNPGSADSVVAQAKALRLEGAEGLRLVSQRSFYLRASASYLRAARSDPFSAREQMEKMDGLVAQLKAHILETSGKLNSPATAPADRTAIQDRLSMYQSSLAQVAQDQSALGKFIADNLPQQAAPTTGQAGVAASE